MSGASEFLDTVGETGEFGGTRVKLPRSYYPCILGVEETGFTDLKDEPLQYKPRGGDWEDVLDANDQVVMKGGTPFVKVNATVFEGPFTGIPAQDRVFLTPGKSGRNIELVNHTIKAITGQPADVTTLKKYNMEFPKGLGKDALQDAFKRYFFTLDAEQRTAFMAQYARLAAWDGARVIVSVGLEKGEERIDDTTGEPYTPYYNRFQGFYALNDPKHGAEVVRATCFAQQEEAAAAMV